MTAVQYAASYLQSILTIAFNSFSFRHVTTVTDPQTDSRDAKYSTTSFTLHNTYYVLKCNQPTESWQKLTNPFHLEINQ